jgi:hypothetical protein
MFKRYKNASNETKFFVFNWVIYGLALIITTIYCFGRLDYVRSYATKNVESSTQSK